MPSEKTPRHSKSKDEPVTIELTASEVDENEATSDASEPAAAMTPETAEREAETTSADEPDAEAGGKVEEDKKEDPSPAIATSPAPTRGGGSTTGAIAAGIFGGLVALAGAGTAQYAGYIPNFGPQETITDYGPDIVTLKSQVEALENKEVPTVDLSPVQARLDKLEQQMSELPLADLTDVKAMQGALTEATDKVAKADAEIASLANRLKQAEQKIGEPRDDVEVARAIASAGLKAAIDRGGPFTAELNTLATVVPDDPAVVELKLYAETGIPSRANLIRDFPDVADTMIAATHQPDESQSISERLMNSALSVIKVRPVGNVSGDSTEAIVARIEEKLQNGDLKGSAGEWDKLPDAARAAGEAFKKSLDARIRVEELVGSTLTNAVTGTNR